ncbi:hypothetical protein [Nonomuraea sp. NPDC005650]|uniref:hypothetical protein n=1 Tax=Nonomuraea sp. NPDC005650 TaxID=3157045 RepID=UPI0033A84626
MKRLVLAWAATAVAATGAAVAVLALLGTGLTGDSGHVLSQAEVSAALNTATQRATGAPPTGVATPTLTPTPTTQASQDRLIRTAGGTVIASCAGDLVTLRSWSPAQNYSVDTVEPGPARRAKVEFEPEEGADVELRIECSNGLPVAGHDS